MRLAVFRRSSTPETAIWIIGADNGLYMVEPPGLPESENGTRLDARNNDDHTFSWQVEHPCVHFLPDAGLLGVSLDGDGIEVPGGPAWQEVVVERPGARGRADAVQVHVTRRVRADTRGATVTATLGFRRTASAEFQPIPGSETKVNVGWGPWDHAKDYLTRLVRGWSRAQMVLFGGVLIAARRRAWAWDVVTDPIWGKVGLWFWAGLRLLPGLQRWVLARWRRRSARHIRRKTICRCRSRARNARR